MDARCEIDASNAPTLGLDAGIPCPAPIELSMEMPSLNEKPWELL
jgi:hypothetical protein